MVIGLEFDVVYAFGKYMTKNEKYIAYTRALERPVVIQANKRTKYIKFIRITTPNTVNIRF